MERNRKAFWGSFIDLVKGARSFYPVGGVGNKDADGWAKYFGNSALGSVVATNETALAFAAYLNCLIVLSEDISTLPVSVIKETPDGSKTQNKHIVHQLLHKKPNGLMNPCDFWKLQIWKVGKDGNSINFIERDEFANPINIWPVAKADVLDIVITEEGRLIYKIESRGNVYSDDILHFKRLSENGLWGKSLVAYQKDNIETGLSSQKYGNDVYKNGAQYDVLVKHPNILTPTAKENIKKDVELTRNTPKDQRREIEKTLVLEEGMQIERISFSPSESEFIISQKWTAQTVSGLWRVPQEFIGLTENSNNSINEQNTLNYVKFGLTPWLVMMEQELNRKLFKVKDSVDHFVKFNLNAIQRGDIATRTEHYSKMFAMGAYNGNDIMDLEDRPHYEGGKLRLIPINNLLPLDKVEEYSNTLIKKQLTSGGGNNGKADS